MKYLCLIFFLVEQKKKYLIDYIFIVRSKHNSSRIKHLLFQYHKLLTIINLNRRAGIRGATTIGVTCLAVASEHVRDKYLTDGGFSTSSTLLVGSEIGALMKCNLDIDDSNPVIFTYEVPI